MFINSGSGLEEGEGAAGTEDGRAQQAATGAAQVRKDFSTNPLL